MGVGRVVELGFTTEIENPEVLAAAMTPEELELLAQLSLACLDVHAMFVEEFMAAGIDREASVCIADGLAGAEFIEDLVIAAMAGQTLDPFADPDALTLITDLVGICMTG
jgi:hypothetical protein